MYSTMEFMLNYGVGATVQCGNGAGSFCFNLTDLTDGTTYYYKAYATNSEGTAYGEVKQFTTSVGTTGTLNGYGWVDLGLPSGLRWATCNVGAVNPEDYGNYYAWGETTTKETYNWSTYRYCIGSNSDNSDLTKYNSNPQNGYYQFTDTLTILEASDDAAVYWWGSGWRMPTKAEMEELHTNCTWTWATQNGVNGRLVTGPNGNSIFLPAAGYRNGSSLYDVGSVGYYWSSSLNTNGSKCAWSLKFYSRLYAFFNDLYRINGFSVRPVCEP
jgi:hypothetical protein